jgi:hypothetical protein
VQGEPSAVARAHGEELVVHRNAAEESAESAARPLGQPARREELQSAAEGPVRLGEAAVRPVGARSAEEEQEQMAVPTVVAHHRYRRSHLRLRSVAGGSVRPAAAEGPSTLQRPVVPVRCTLRLLLLHHLLRTSQIQRSVGDC